MEDDQSPATEAQAATAETPPAETQQAAAPPQEAPQEPTLAQALEIAKAKAEAASAKRDAAHQAAQAKLGDREPRGPRGDRPPRGPGGDNRGDNRGGGPGGGPRREGRPDRGPGGREGGPRHEGRHEGRPGGGGGRPFDGFAADIELEKLISDSLYLDNQAHAVVVRMRDMDSGTKSQLRRLYNAVRRAVRAPENERQHQFVMLRARLAYTIARHSLRSLDALERLLLQVTRRNDARGYERFKDLFEAIVAYNE
ncbi:MAG TPA: type III-A CRISPR-associated protein Csm2 [Bryobacteraceae bacterium]